MDCYGKISVNYAQLTLLTRLTKNDQQELYEMRSRLDEADRIILLAEERLHEHNIIDENLSAMLAKVKLHSEAELRRFKEESDISYQSGVC